MSVGPEAMPMKAHSFTLGHGCRVILAKFCRGWSTVLLNSIGALFHIGDFDGLRWAPAETQERSLKQLTFPAGYPPTTKARYDPSTAIKQFSVGRTHVLGLADDGKIWYWARKEAFQIKLLYVDLTRDNTHRVVAGIFKLLCA